MLLRASPPRQLLPPVLPEDAPYNSLLLASALRVAVDRLHSHLHDAHPPDDMQPNSDSASYDPHSHYQLVTRAQAIARRYSSTSPAASPVQPDAYQLTYPPPPSFPSSDVRYTDPLVPLEVAQPSPVLAPHYAWPPADVPAPYTTPLHRYDTTLQGRSDLYSVPRGMQAHYSPVAPSPIAPYSWPQPPNESFDVGSERPSPASIPAPGAASTSHIYDPTDGAYPIPLSPSGSQDDQLSLANSSPSEPRARRGHAKSSSKTYSFVSLPGSHAKKRPRRRYDEIERLYQCNFILPSGTQCTKGYGTLNHLNAHIVMQRHGEKRQPSEFKEMRKRWRKMKKEPDDDGLPLAEGSRHARPQLAVRIPYTYSPARYTPEPSSAYMSAQPPMSGLPYASPTPFMEPLRVDPRPGVYEAPPRAAYEELPRSAYEPTRSAYENHARGAYEEQPRSAYEDHPRSALEDPPRSAYEDHPRSAYEEHPRSAYSDSAYQFGQGQGHLPTQDFPPYLTRTTYLTPITPTTSRLPPDSTLLTPLPGYVPADRASDAPPPGHS